MDKEMDQKAYSVDQLQSKIGDILEWIDGVRDDVLLPSYPSGSTGVGEIAHRYKVDSDQLIGFHLKTGDSVEVLETLLKKMQAFVRDVTDAVLMPLAHEIPGGIGAVAEAYGGASVALLAS
jgi:hypothetical protein